MSVDPEMEGVETSAESALESEAGSEEEADLGDAFRAEDGSRRQ